MTRQVMHLSTAVVLTLFSCVALAGTRATATAGSLPAVTIIGTATDNSSVKVSYYPVPGAQDYRVFDVNSPTTVKYAGMAHLEAGPGRTFVMQPGGVTPVFPYTTTWGGNGATALNVPGTEIQWNAIEDGAPHTIVVQALDHLGPVPPGNLATYWNTALYPPAGMLGANDGLTQDGNESINGQGPPTSTVHVIAQSAPIVVQANSSYAPLPSMSGALQTFFDTFDDQEATSLKPILPVNVATGDMTYTLNSGDPSKGWDVRFQGADTNQSFPMVDKGHFMDALFDGRTASTLSQKTCQPTNPFQTLCPHTDYASMSLTPQTTADLSGGKLLHITQEVDTHLADFNRWFAWQLAPAADPITNFRADDFVTGGNSQPPNRFQINQSDKALWLQLFGQTCDAMLAEGPLSSTNSAPATNPFIPAQTTGSPAPCYHMNNWGGTGLSLDDRSRVDIFLTAVSAGGKPAHVAIFEDGQLLVQSDIPGGTIGFDQAKLYFTHYLYATNPPSEQSYLLKSAPWEAYWLNYARHSDERHWDNMGFEVLPASVVPANDDFSSLSSLITLPPVVSQAPPAITSVAPSAGSTFGGDSVTITGANLVGATDVRFGNTSAVSYHVDSPTQITAVTPAESAGTVDVSVTTPKGATSPSTSDQFTFAAPQPTITRLSTYTSSTSGGTSVTITGTSFISTTAVNFGAVPASAFTVVSSTQITAVSPPQAFMPGGVYVTVTTPGGTSPTSTGDHFYYVPSQPSIGSISPASGPTAGGTTIIVRGANLFGANQVWFGSTTTTNFVVNSPTQVTVVTPSHNPSTVDIRVGTAGGISPITPGDQFTYAG